MLEKPDVDELDPEEAPAEVLGALPVIYDPFALPLTAALFGTTVADVDDPEEPLEPEELDELEEPDVAVLKPAIILPSEA